MSQFPPAVPPPNINYAPPAPRPANVLAIVSLICGILGCFVITPIVAIITGALGLGKARVQGGRGMAVAGIILGVLWIVGGLGVGGVTYWGVNKVIAVGKQAAVDSINAMVDGDIVKVQQLTTFTPDEAQAMSDQLKAYGKCTDVSISSFNSQANGGGKSISVSGTATFATAGKKSFTATAGQHGDKFLVEQLHVD